jgi:hypothetical protein
MAENSGRGLITSYYLEINVRPVIKGANVQRLQENLDGFVQDLKVTEKPNGEAVIEFPRLYEDYRSILLEGAVSAGYQEVS